MASSLGSSTCGTFTVGGDEEWYGRYPQSMKEGPEPGGSKATSTSVNGCAPNRIAPQVAVSTCLIFTRMPMSSKNFATDTAKSPHTEPRNSPHSMVMSKPRG